MREFLASCQNKFGLSVARRGLDRLLALTEALSGELKGYSLGPGEDHNGIEYQLHINTLHLCLIVETENNN